MLKAIRKTWTALLIAVATLFATLGFAAPAMAYYDHYSHYELSPCVSVYGGPGYRTITYWYWRDYDWWEEVFQGKRDHWIYHTYSYGYC